jgi:DNA-directed RNA polymerase specialized sigma24 family protein
MIEAPTSTPVATTAACGDRLDFLVDRIADRDRAAFRCLYAFLAMRVWRDAVRALPHPADARAVTRSTFVEAWHLARHHVDHTRIDTRTWIAAITARHVGDRLRAPNTPCPLLGDHDSQIHRELVALLGAGPATIRISPATFARVDEINLDIAT